MTTFEITIIVLLAAIAVLLAWHCMLTRNNYSLNQTKELKRQQDFKRLVNQLYGIKAEVGQTNARIDGFIPWARHLRQKADNLENAWACDITSIIGALRRLENCLTQDINWGELTDGQKSEILYRLTHPVVESPFKPPFNPTCETTNNSDDVYAECRRMDAINTASVCENMTKIQKELQEKDGNADIQQ